MSISRLQNKSKWIELGSASATSGTAVSFTSISSAYNDLLLTWNDAFATSAADLSVRFNNDSGTNYSFNYGWQNYNGPVFSLESDGNSSEISLNGIRDTYPASGHLLIEGANDIFKTITFQNCVNDASNSSDMAWNGVAYYWDQTAINRIDFRSSLTFSAGTIKVYGRN
jgi:hypothetical protein